MRIALAAEGTRGDVHPLLGLGSLLAERGHEVVICAPPDFSGDICFQSEAWSARKVSWGAMGARGSKRKWPCLMAPSRHVPGSFSTIVSFFVFISCHRVSPTQTMTCRVRGRRRRRSTRMASAVSAARD